MKKIILIAFIFSCQTLSAQKNNRTEAINTASDKIEQKVIDWRHDFHSHPELGNREFRTSEIIAKHLESLGLEVQRKVGVTGVVGILKGGKPGPVIALRADMDGLPVTENNDLSFKSTVKTMYNGKETGVMHACGHDAHVSILMGVAEILTGMKKDLKGTVKFIFQPAEEGAPKGEEGGAELMVKEGVLDNPKVDVIFGLHMNAQIEAGKKFVKTWKIKNIGSCNWTTTYTIRYGYSDRMSGRDSYLREVILPGQEAEISLELTAPTKPGTYRGYWVLFDNNGYSFGQYLSVIITVP